jgi:hypothetical protein
MNVKIACALMLVLGLVWGCGEDKTSTEEAPNPFLENLENHSKEDTQYVNPDGIEVEVDIEADIEAPSYKIKDAPAALGQFALTYLRKRNEFYLESLAEDATSDERVEWRVDGEWMAAADLGDTPNEKLTHFRIRGINAVLLHSAANGVEAGSQFLAKVPKTPYGLMGKVADRCADHDSHMNLSDSVYWYLWNPDKSGCDEDQVQEMMLTVSKMMPSGPVTYPEYDQLVADGKVTAVVMFGKIGDGDIETDSGMRGFKKMADWLLGADFAEVPDAPVGRRFTKAVGPYTYEIDLYSPKDFSGLSDYGNYSNFERAVTQHEIVAYDGHSMLGSSDFWAKPDYPDFYQIFLYGGCLGYEYYISPILKGKGGWDKVDIVSSVIEVWAGANLFAGPVLAKMMWAMEHNFNVSWKDMLVAIRARVGDSTFGVCGATGNCFSPGGSLCDDIEPVEGETERFEDTTVVAIPDNTDTGITSTLDIAGQPIALRVTLDLDITHTYCGDLRIKLEHDGTVAHVWENAGGQSVDLKQTFVLDDFAGEVAGGTWSLTVADTWEADTGTLNSWALEVVFQE